MTSHVDIPKMQLQHNSAVKVLTSPAYVGISLLGQKAHVVPGTFLIQGDLLTEATVELSQTAIHSSVSGIVREIRDNLVVVDGHWESPPIAESGKHICLEQISRIEILHHVQQAGIVGMGGGMFPTHRKFPLAPEQYHTVIINASESGPYLCSDHRLLSEHRDDIECGMKAAMRACGAERAIIADHQTHDYYDGHERFVVERVLGISLEKAQRPQDVGVLVLNVQTAKAIHDAICLKRPLMERVITVDGPLVKKPGNYLMPIGTPVSHLLSECKIHLPSDGVLIIGDPIMGKHVAPQDFITPGSTALLAFHHHEIHWPDENARCVRCGMCIEVCPFHLNIPSLVQQAQAGLPDEDIEQCISCGLCQYVCTGQRPLASLLKEAKFKCLSLCKRCYK